MRSAAGSDSFPLSGAEITAARRDLVERAQAHRLRPEDREGATFSLSNQGMYAVEAFSAIVNTPGAAILAPGSITDRWCGPRW